MAHDTSHPIAGWLNGLGAGACWGSIFLCPLLVPDFTGLQLSVARYLIFGLLSLLLAARSVQRVPAHLWWRFLFLGTIGNLAYYMLVGMAVVRIGAAQTALMTGFIPVLVTVFGLGEAEAVSWRRLWPSMALMACGILLLGRSGLSHGSASLTGLGAAVGALLLWSLFATLNTRWMRQFSQVETGLWGHATGIATGALALLALPASGLWAASHAPERWGVFAASVLMLAAIASVCGSFFWNRCCRALPMTLAGQMVVSETLFALLYGCLWVHTLPSAIECLASLMLLLSVVLSVRAHRA